jgi:hypothetical protein
MLDGSIEPPFLIGMTCGACHIAFNPLKPPKDPEHPSWENIDGLVGNQYSRMSEVMASGMPESSLEWQIDWSRVLRSSNRGERFKTWGMINDPDCCAPGSPNCPKRSLDETFGFDYCPGDDDLLAHVGKAGYRDPACTFQDAPLTPKQAHGDKNQRQDPCDLAFGTSTGALGLRKFPNPRFNAERWRTLNGSPGSWAGFTRPLGDSGPDARISRPSRCWKT